MKKLLLISALLLLVASNGWAEEKTEVEKSLDDAYESIGEITKWYEDKLKEIDNKFASREERVCYIFSRIIVRDENGEAVLDEKDRIVFKDRTLDEVLESFETKCIKGDAINYSNMESLDETAYQIVAPTVCDLSKTISIIDEQLTFSEVLLGSTYFSDSLICSYIGYIRKARKQMQIKGLTDNQSE